MPASKVATPNKAVVGLVLFIIAIFLKKISAGHKKPCQKERTLERLVRVVTRGTHRKAVPNWRQREVDQGGGSQAPSTSASVHVPCFDVERTGVCVAGGSRVTTRQSGRRFVRPVVDGGARDPLGPVCESPLATRKRQTKNKKTPGYRGCVGRLAWRRNSTSSGCVRGAGCGPRYPKKRGSKGKKGRNTQFSVLFKFSAEPKKRRSLTDALSYGANDPNTEIAGAKTRLSGNDGDGQVQPEAKTYHLQAPLQRSVRGTICPPPRSRLSS